MEFNWDDYPAEEPLTGEFLKEAETLLMIAQGTPFFITGISENDDGKFGPQWQVALILADGSEKIKTHKKGIAPRDKQVAGFRDYFATEDAEPLKARFVKKGRSIQYEGVI